MKKASNYIDQHRKYKFVLSDAMRIKEIMKRSPHGIRLSTLSKLVNLDKDLINFYLLCWQGQDIVSVKEIKGVKVYFMKS